MTSTYNDSRARSWLILLILAFSMNVYSCVTKSPKDEAFSQLVELGSVNKEITLTLVPLDDGSPVPYIPEVRNNTSSFIVFPKDLGVRLFQYNAEGWVEIPNKMQVISDQEQTYLHPKGEMIDREGIDFTPDLPDRVSIVTIRLLVSGNMYDKSDAMVGKKVSAFIDIDWQASP